MSSIATGRAQEATGPARLAGPFMVGWIKDASGSYILGLLAMAAVLAATTALAMSLKLVGREE